MTSLVARLRKRPALAKAYETRPARITPRPEEPEIIERMRAMDLTALGL